jgi:hypothetical protein
MTKSWRDHWPVHSAAELFPLMTEAELCELGEDIKNKGLTTPIALWAKSQMDWDKKKIHLLDGRNRLDAMELAGLDALEVVGRQYFTLLGDDPYAYVISANIQRRHLTADQRRELIAAVLKAKPEQSNLQIAKQVKADDKTVAKVRKKLESTSDIPRLEKTIGADGKARKQPVKRRPAVQVVHASAEAAHGKSTEILTVEDDLESTEYREAFILRTADAMAFAVYSGEVDDEIIAAAERAAAAWTRCAAGLKQRMATPDPVPLDALEFEQANRTDKKRRRKAKLEAAE